MRDNTPGFGKAGSSACSAVSVFITGIQIKRSTWWATRKTGGGEIREIYTTSRVRQQRPLQEVGLALWVHHRRSRKTARRRRLDWMGEAVTTQQAGNQAKRSGDVGVYKYVFGFIMPSKEKLPLLFIYKMKEQKTKSKAERRRESQRGTASGVKHPQK